MNSKQHRPLMKRRRPYARSHLQRRPIYVFSSQIYSPCNATGAIKILRMSVFYGGKLDKGSWYLTLSLKGRRPHNFELVDRDWDNA